MKKILLTIIILLTITGCSARKRNQNKVQPKQNDIIEKMNEEYKVVKMETALTEEEQRILNSGDPFKFYANENNAYIIYPYPAKDANAQKELYKLEGVDLKSFKPLGFYAKDKDYAYFNTRSFIADVNTFEAISASYAKDKNAVYFEGTALVDANPHTAKAIDDYCLVDDMHVYHIDKILQGADPKTYVILEAGYSKDLKNVYYGDNILLDADPETFEILANSHYSKDKNSVFAVFSDDDIKKIEGADSTSFATLDGAYAKDNAHVYNGGEIMQNINPKTFKP